MSGGSMAGSRDIYRLDIDNYVIEKLTIKLPHWFFLHRTDFQNTFSVLPLRSFDNHVSCETFQNKIWICSTWVCEIRIKNGLQDPDDMKKCFLFDGENLFPGDQLQVRPRKLIKMKQFQRLIWISLFRLGITEEIWLK